MTRTLRNIPARMAKWLTEPIEIKRPVSTVGEYGEQLNAYQTSETVGGRVIGLRKKDYEDFGLQEGATTIYRAILPLGTVVQAGDALMVGGVLMDVIGIDDAVTGRPDVQVLVAVRNGS